ncbi:transposase [Saliphagus sp. LR7]|uniref:transposase n=1 Tax=Saliphagus sp. LR7 TaxID=2282654 RepID=UPI000DF869B1
MTRRNLQIWNGQRLRQPLAVSGGQASINLLGAVTDDGEPFISFVDGSFTGKVAAHFLRALQKEFGERLVIVLDNAPYFIAKCLKKQAANAGLLLEYLPPYAPEMNPLEQCWRQLNKKSANKLYRTLPELKAYLTSQLPTLSSPTIYEYLC